MVPWWRRLAYSLISVLLAGTVVGLVDVSWSAFFDSESHIGLERFLVSICIVIGFSLPGWLIAIPVVLLVRDYSSWRGWVWAAGGVCIGPGVIFGFALCAFITDRPSPGFLSGTKLLFLLVAAVSTLSTAVYLLLVLKRKPLRQATVGAPNPTRAG